MRGRVMELGVFPTRIELTNTPELLVMSARPRMMLHRKVKLFFPPVPVSQWKTRSSTHFSTRSLCRAEDGQGELGSAALPVPSAGPESRAGSSSLSCRSHFRHTGRKRMVWLAGTGNV